MPALFVAGAGTEIGKTYVTAALTRRLRAGGVRVRTLKPLASGVPPVSDPAFAESDTGRLLAAQGVPVSLEAASACSPWRFAAPLAPDQAAAREGRRLALAELVAFCRTEIESPALDLRQDVLLIEGVGGLMSPVTPEATGLDWLRALGLPTLLVSGSYLGAISHTLTAVETLARHGVPLRAVVVSASSGLPAPETGAALPAAHETVAESIRRHAGVPVLTLARGADCPAELAGLTLGIG